MMAMIPCPFALRRGALQPHPAHLQILGGIIPSFPLMFNQWFPHQLPIMTSHQSSPAPLDSGFRRNDVMDARNDNLSGHPPNPLTLREGGRGS